MTSQQASSLIKSKALQIGFSACGIAEADRVSVEAEAELRHWLEVGYDADLHYMRAHESLRLDPRELHPGCRSLIVVALNYYPSSRQQGDIRFSTYAYGADYHYVLKHYLSQLSDYIAKEIAPLLSPQQSYDARPFVDSAPLMEHYWAYRAGVGFMGRNRLLIVPRVGSYCFLGILATNLSLSTDHPLSIGCGTCRRCLDACPTGALTSDPHMQTGSIVDARRCLSYHTIESRAAEIPAEIAAQMGNRVYGCDVCQECCPWNRRFARPTHVPEFLPSEQFLALDSDRLAAMSPGDFRRLFRHSAISRAGYKGLQRNLRVVRSNLGTPEE